MATLFTPMKRLSLPKACSQFGAQMGRRNLMPIDPSQPIKLQMERVPFIDQCYDRWGAYWGMPSNLYCAWGYDSDVTGDLVQVFVRANSRHEAKAKVRELIPASKFYR